jgi:hypothetical protein
VNRRRALPVEAEVFGLVEGPLERAPPVNDIGEIDERPGGSGHHNPTPPDPLPPQRRPVHDDPAAHPIALHRHMNQLTSILEDFPQNGSTEVAQSGTLSAGEHSGHEPPVTSKRQMPHGVHTGVNAMEPAPLDPPIDRVAAHPKRQELNSGHHAVLPPREPRNRAIEGVLAG